MTKGKRNARGGILRFCNIKEFLKTFKGCKASPNKISYSLPIPPKNLPIKKLHFFTLTKDVLKLRIL